MSDDTFKQSIDKAVRDVQANSARVEVDTEQVEAAITHTAASWSVTGYLRKKFGRKGLDAGGKVEKSW